VFGWWLELAQRSTATSLARARFKYAGSLAGCLLQSATIQFALGSLPALAMVMVFPEVTLTQIWEHPAFARVGWQASLWQGECWGLGLSVILLVVLAVADPARSPATRSERKLP
jgi:hypothetical protein